jgi:hypothetical protein
MSDELRFFERALARITRWTLWMTVGGILVAVIWRGWTWAAGFALGSAVSWLNFRLMKQVVDSLGQKRPTRKRVAILAGLRYALLGGGAYAILHYSRISMTATLIGLFVSVAAVIVEICFELVYARI